MGEEQQVFLEGMLSNDEVSQLYQKIPGVWVLFEQLELKEGGKASLVKLLKYNEDKEVLRNYVMDHVMDDEDWESEHPLIYFFTGFDGTCKI